MRAPPAHPPGVPSLGFALLQKEFGKVARLTAMGFVAVGLIGFLVKVIFIPINQVSAWLGCASQRSAALGASVGGCCAGVHLCSCGAPELACVGNRRCWLLGAGLCR